MKQLVKCCDRNPRGGYPSEKGLQLFRDPWYFRFQIERLFAFKEQPWDLRLASTTTGSASARDTTNRLTDRSWVLGVSKHLWGVRLQILTCSCRAKVGYWIRLWSPGSGQECTKSTLSHTRSNWKWVIDSSIESLWPPLSNASGLSHFRVDLVSSLIGKTVAWVASLKLEFLEKHGFIKDLTNRPWHGRFSKIIHDLVWTPAGKQSSKFSMDGGETTTATAIIRQKQQWWLLLLSLSLISDDDVPSAIALTACSSWWQRSAEDDLQFKIPPGISSLPAGMVSLHPLYYVQRLIFALIGCS